SGVASLVLGNSCFDCLDRVLNDVKNGLADKPSIAVQQNSMIREVRFEGDVAVCRELEKHRAMDNFDEVLGPQYRSRHSSASREFIDHPADVANMSDNSVGTDRKGFTILGDFLQIPPAQSLGGKLNGRQRVLDLMGDPACNVRPGGLSLSR